LICTLLMEWCTLLKWSPTLVGPLALAEGGAELQFVLCLMSTKCCTNLSLMLLLV
jgi:hypothetical protein